MAKSDDDPITFICTPVRCIVGCIVGCIVPLLMLLPFAMMYVGIAGPSDMCECPVNRFECQTTFTANLSAFTTTSTFNATNTANGTITQTNMTNGTIILSNGTAIRVARTYLKLKKPVHNPAARNLTTIPLSTTANPFVTMHSGHTTPLADIVNRRSTIISVRDWLIVASVLMIVFYMGICVAFANTVFTWCTAFFMIIPFYIWCILGIKIWQALQGTCEDANFQLYNEFFAPNAWIKGISITFVSWLSLVLLGFFCAAVPEKNPNVQPPPTRTIIGVGPPNSDTAGDESHV